ncbi:hypothetical protein [Methylobacterium sp. J-092]|uniref:hypothetical protein n=1 Tax=Methylobacterium sp. J-092 TaxID=2836667 RepID=UPI001FBB0EC9|nr:hypothetical protein [Methylobacterium sp. J-092]MCJ2009194.1 hypothetical protein [Methylobacterium sp. J-092]
MIEAELLGWALSLFACVPGEDYQARIWECGDTPEVELQVYVNAATPATALA